MASITKREKSKFWIACFTDRDGRQLKRSTKTTDRRTALQIALELERVERQAMAGAITTVQLRKVLSDVSEKINGDSLIAPSAEDYLNDWLKTLAVRNRVGTIERYDKTVRLFLESLGGRAQKPISGVSPKDIETFLTRRLESGVAPQTAAIDLKTMRRPPARPKRCGCSGSVRIWSLAVGGKTCIWEPCSNARWNRVATSSTSNGRSI
jgi:hypothetical protein